MDSTDLLDSLLDSGLTRSELLARATALAIGGSSLGAVLSACDFAGGEGKAGTLIFGTELADIPNLDGNVALTSGGAGYRVVMPMFEALTNYDLHDEEAPIVSGLADSWTQLDDGKTWEFKLREGVTFHDGTQWNADAAIWNLRRLYDPKAPHYYQLAGSLAAALGFPGPLVGIEKIDDTTFRMKLAQVRPLPEELVLVFMVSPAAVEKLGNDGFAKAPVGTGPFMFKEVVQGQKVELVPYPGYWGSKAKLDRLIMRPIPDPSARVSALRAGEINMAIVIPPDSVESLKGEGFEVLLKPYPHTWCYHFNLPEKPYNDVRVRRALNYALDKETLVNDVLRGTAEPAYQVATVGSPFFDDSLPEYYKYDPDKAKQLLADAGLAGGFETVWWHPTQGSGMMLPVQMTEFIQSNLRDVGVIVNTKTFEWGAYLGEFFKGMRKGIGAYNQSWGLWGTAWWGYLFGSIGIPPKGIANVGYYQNPEIDRLYEQVLAKPEEVDRIEAAKQIQKIAMDDAPWLFVCHDLNSKALSPKVHGFVNTHQWWFAFDDLTVEA